MLFLKLNAVFHFFLRPQERVIKRSDVSIKTIALITHRKRLPENSTQENSTQENSTQKTQHKKTQHTKTQHRKLNTF